MVVANSSVSASNVMKHNAANFIPLIHRHIIVFEYKKKSRENHETFGEKGNFFL